jgi:hypothetical protein
MIEESRIDPDRARVAALERVKRGELYVRLAVIAAAVVEAAGLLGFLLLMDFGNRLHLLLLVMAFLIYGTLAMGIIALGAYVNLCSQRILKALLVGDEPRPS